MTRKRLVGIIAAVVLAVGVSIYSAFHPSRAFVSHSPTSHWRAVDCIVTGFRDVSYDFRVHDLRANPFKPIFIGDLYWADKYFSGDVFWSRDGTVAAASIIYYAGQREAFGCAYDFREHRVIRPGSSSSALDDSKDQEIRLLLDSRGGYDRVKLPSFKEV